MRKEIHKYILGLILISSLFLTSCGSTSTNKKPIRKISPSSAHSQSIPQPIEEFSDDLPASEEGKEIMLYALGLMNTKYTFGGKNPEAGFDCSGLISYVYKNAVNINLTGNAATQAKSGKQISRSNLRPGDIIFFNTTGIPYSHAGIYVGNNRFIHAPNSRGAVRLQSIANGYWKSKIIEFRSYVD